MNKDNNRRNRGRGYQDKEVLRTARIVKEAIETAATRTATVQRKDGKSPVTRRKLEASNESGEEQRDRKGMAYRISLENISRGDGGFVNAIYTKSDDKAKSGIETSLSTHKAFEHKRFGRILPVFIPQKIRSSKKLDDNNNEIGDWVKENVIDWEKGIWFSKIGHMNIISDRPLDNNEHITGRALVSSKRVDQHTRKGGKEYYFPHVIILETQSKVKPALTLVLNNDPGEDVPGEIHIGPTIGALQNDKEVKEYLHLKPYK